MAEELQEEVSRLAGDRYTRKDNQNPNRRWGSQQGSVYLSDQKVPVSVPRVRNVVTEEEVSLQTYHHLQRPRRMDEGLLLRMIKGIATRSYQASAEANPKPLGCPIDGIETLYQGVGRKIKTVPGTLFSTV